MAHYIEQNQQNTEPKESIEKLYDKILHNNQVKQISIVFMRKLTAKQIQKSLLKSLKLNTNEDEYKEILPDIERFMKAINGDVKRGDKFVLRWSPDGTITSIYQGQEVSSITNQKFAKTLWLIWFGDDSVVDKSLLIKELLTSS